MPAAVEWAKEPEGMQVFAVVEERTVGSVQWERAIVKNRRKNI